MFDGGLGRAAASGGKLAAQIPRTFSSGKLQTLAFYITLGHLHYGPFLNTAGFIFSFLSSLHFILTPLTSPLSHSPYKCLKSEY